MAAQLAELGVATVLLGPCHGRGAVVQDTKWWQPRAIATFTLHVSVINNKIIFTVKGQQFSIVK